VNEVPTVSISIVSHNQGDLVYRLLRDIKLVCSYDIEVILTLNIAEKLPFQCETFPFPVRLIKNSVCKGFGENHNNAFRIAKGECFCVINPDIRLTLNPFPILMKSFEYSGRVALVAPLVRGPAGDIEDSARRFLTPLTVLIRVITRRCKSDYVINEMQLSPDWVAGMFMLFPSEVYLEMGGFDERYFMYLEDVDLCARVKLIGKIVVLNPAVSVIHDARRQSRKSPKYFGWHLRSMIRFFCSRVFFSILLRNRN